MERVKTWIMQVVTKLYRFGEHLGKYMPTIISVMGIIPLL